MRRLTVPGNLLLLGEYAVLEEGGLGVAAAVERRVVVTVKKAEETEITGAWGTAAAEWKASERGSSSLFGAVAAATERILRLRADVDELPRVHLHVDSSALFGSDGGKTGFGSSAASSVGVSYALLRSSGFGPTDALHAAFSAAIEGHRSFQGGRGSGYDVAASAFGGIGLFTGGTVPSFERLDLPWLGPFGLVRGAAPVRTPQSIERYLAWRSRSPSEAQRFLEASNAAVRGFASSRHMNEALIKLREAADLGARLGEAIGVPAFIELPAPLRRRFESGDILVKALGAGNEIGAVWSTGTALLPEGLTAVEIAESGVIWRE
jgi:phosphomevalonate kinase